MAAKKKANKIHLNPAHAGEFTAKAKAHGESVQQYAERVLHDPHADAHTKKQAQFAVNAKQFHHGGKRQAHK